MALAKVLIVEDEVLVALELEATLEELGYESVGIAADSRSALALASENPDVALVDLNLRDGPTGPAIGAALASNHNVRVVFLTANPRMLSEFRHTAVGVVQKPYEAEDLGAVIDFALDRREAAPSALQVF